MRSTDLYREVIGNVGVNQSFFVPLDYYQFDMGTIFLFQNE